MTRRRGGTTVIDPQDQAHHDLAPEPGKWRIQPMAGTSKLAEITVGNFQGTVVVNCGTDTPKISQLIVAAPELLDALRAVEAHFRKFEVGTGYEANNWPVIKSLIAKAGYP